jgi:hypothetical protein
MKGAQPAVEIFESGFSCSQAVFAAFSRIRSRFVAQAAEVLKAIP